MGGKEGGGESEREREREREREKEREREEHDMHSKYTHLQNSWLVAKGVMG